MSRSKEHQFKTDIYFRTHRIQHFAKKHGWTLVNDDGEVFKFTSPEFAVLRINYWNINVETSLNHPVWGPTVMIRKGEFTQKIIESLFRNPRKHMSSKVKSEYVNKKSKDKN